MSDSDTKNLMPRTIKSFSTFCSNKFAVTHNQYGTFRKLQMLCWLLRTKIIWRRARLIRFPFDLRGKKYIDSGIGLTTGVGCRLEAYSNGPVRSPFRAERTTERSRTYLRHAKNRDRQSRTDGQQDLHIRQQSRPIRRLEGQFGSGNPATRTLLSDRTRFYRR